MSWLYGLNDSYVKLFNEIRGFVKWHVLGYVLIGLAMEINGNSDGKIHAEWTMESRGKGIEEFIENQVAKGPAKGPEELGAKGPVELWENIEQDNVVNIVAELPQVIAQGIVGTTAEVKVGNIREDYRAELLRKNGWENEMIEQAIKVVQCESGWNAESRNGNYVGLFQLEIGTWFRYANEDSNMWNDPDTNARVGWQVILYDRGKGYSEWAQWQCKP